MNARSLAGIALRLVHHGLGSVAWLLGTLPAPPGRWRKASNRHRYRESA